MDGNTNHLGQPIGEPVGSWKAPPLPARERMTGRECSVQPLDAGRHGETLFASNALDTEGRSWTYLPYGPFEDRKRYRDWLESVSVPDDPLYFSIVESKSGDAVGVASYLRVHPEVGSIEVGHIHFSPRLQRTVAATEAMYLMMANAFDLGYRRYEWKCDALNRPSRDAALRLGFSFEGVFRQATMYKGRNRDTAWYAMVDGDWPAVRDAFRRWLDPANFDDRGQQKLRLSELTRPVLQRIG